MAFYVCLDDNAINPTYTVANKAFLIESNEENYNPCARNFTKREVSVMPKNIDDLKIFADIMGWSVETDNDGQVILYTGMQE